MSLKNSNDIIGNRTRDLPVCSVVENLVAFFYFRVILLMFIVSDICRIYYD